MRLKAKLLAFLKSFKKPRKYYVDVEDFNEVIDKFYSKLEKEINYRKAHVRVNINRLKDEILELKDKVDFLHTRLTSIEQRIALMEIEAKKS